MSFKIKNSELIFEAEKEYKAGTIEDEACSLTMNADQHLVFDYNGWAISVDLLKLLQAVSTSSEAKRLLQAGAILIDNLPVKDFKAEVYWKPDMVIKVGKHKIYKIK